ncbi:MAG TPA: toxin-antitoxin system [Mycobacterium sp.]|nr:toxin-antitoxin system [Mycobacterium sp.]HUH71407.1 toxin-antitoxin system [Mycobacterium sp.]
MARPSKGDRVVTVARVARPVWDHIRAESDRCGVSISAYVADLLAAAVGRGDLIREIDHQEVLPLAI